MSLSESFSRENVCKTSFPFTSGISNDLKELLCCALPDWVIGGPSQEMERYIITSSSRCSFLFLMDNFFLAYDETTRVLHAMVPGSRIIEMKYDELKESKNCFMRMIGATFSIQQVYFLARKSGCLAQVEKGLPGAEIPRF